MVGTHGEYTLTLYRLSQKWGVDALSRDYGNVCQYYWDFKRHLLPIAFHIYCHGIMSCIPYRVVNLYNYCDVSQYCIRAALCRTRSIISQGSVCILLLIFAYRGLCLCQAVRSCVSLPGYLLQVILKSGSLRAKLIAAWTSWLPR